MELRHLGSSGLRLSAVGLGCNNFGLRLDAKLSATVVNTALDEGVNHFDTAESYGRSDHLGASEEYLGRALGARRSDVVIATKFGSPNFPSAYPPGGSRRYLVSAAEESLRRLGTDWIDLYYLHYWDARTPVDETLAALDDLVSSGKVRYVAVSNLAAWQLVEADHVARRDRRSRFVGVQAEWSLLRRRVERELVPAATHLGVGVVPYFPLASGLLTGKYRGRAEPPLGSRFDAVPRLAQGYTDEDRARVDRLAACAEERGHTLLELAMSWLARQPAVASVIAGATSSEQVEANVAAVRWDLTQEDLAAVDAALAG